MQSVSGLNTSFYFGVRFLKKIRIFVQQSERRYRKTHNIHDKLVFDMMKQAYDLGVFKLTNYQCVMEAVEFYLCALIRSSQRNRLAHTTLEESGYRVRYQATRTTFTKLVRIYEKIKMEMSVIECLS